METLSVGGMRMETCTDLDVMVQTTAIRDGPSDPYDVLIAFIVPSDLIINLADKLLDCVGLPARGSKGSVVNRQAFARSVIMGTALAGRRANHLRIINLREPAGPTIMRSAIRSARLNPYRPGILFSISLNAL